MSTFVWKGKTIENVTDIVSALCGLRNETEARAFMDAYRRVSPHADKNAGYCVGYIGGGNAVDAERRARIHGWLGVTHPVFGTDNYGA